MIKTGTVEVKQLSFDDLLEQLDQNPGQLIKLPLGAQDIGASLLAVLSKGLYTNPLDCIREYVQNSVDARASNVTIKITGNSVMIFDDGTGMNLEDLLQARLVGLSPKSLSEHVGFRGIGIYSGFDLCRRLRITTTKAGDSHLYVLIFDFAAMRLALEADKARKLGEQKISLIELLSEHTYIKSEPSEFPPERHFTHVELQDIGDTHIQQLSNRAKLRTYLLQNLPVDFADDFEYKQLINERLYAHVPGYAAIKITLQSDHMEDEVVAKQAISNLQYPTFEYIKNSLDQQIGYCWACLNRGRAIIDKETASEEDTIPKYGGFVYKVKGFTVGNRQKLHPMFARKPQLYRWYTGEIYVLDSNVIPNAERDDFETSQAKEALMVAVRRKLGDLETDAETFQATGVAEERIEKYQAELVNLEEKVVGSPQPDAFKTYSRLDEILIDLRRQKHHAGQPKRDIAESLIKQADKLQNQVRKGVDAPTSEATRRKRAARKERQPSQSALLDLSTMPIQQPVLSPVPTLSAVLREAGWQLDGELAPLVKLLEESLADVLTVGSPIYRGLINDIEAKLASNSSDE